MSRSLSSLAKRRKTIQTTQKITNAMKLVSMSRVQKYRREQLKYEPVYKHVLNIPSEPYVSDKKRLYVAFIPDLGLVSAYSRTLYETISQMEDLTMVIIGTQGFEKFKESQKIDVLNNRMSSENLDVGSIQEFVRLHVDEYQICTILPEVNPAGGIEFNILDQASKLKRDYDMVYEPNYELANQAYQQVYSETMLLNAYYVSKVSEYTMRRVAMEKATDNADDMLYDLQLQYNRLRQEKITEEIADLTQAEDE